MLVVLALMLGALSRAFADAVPLMKTSACHGKTVNTRIKETGGKKLTAVF